jgi:hypothetical protein
MIGIYKKIWHLSTRCGLERLRSSKVQHISVSEPLHLLHIQNQAKFFSLLLTPLIYMQNLRAVSPLTELIKCVPPFYVSLISNLKMI